jgi:hypothetical protein
MRVFSRGGGVAEYPMLTHWRAAARLGASRAHPARSWGPRDLGWDGGCSRGCAATVNWPAWLGGRRGSGKGRRRAPGLAWTVCRMCAMRLGVNVLLQGVGVECLRVRCGMGPKPRKTAVGTCDSELGTLGLGKSRLATRGSTAVWAGRGVAVRVSRILMLRRPDALAGVVVSVQLGPESRPLAHSVA